MSKKKVILERPGVKACGQYEAGKVYDVEAEEAERLIKVKGFRLATKADEDRAATELKKDGTVAPSAGKDGNDTGKAEG